MANTKPFSGDFHGFVESLIRSYNQIEERDFTSGEAAPQERGLSRLGTIVKGGISTLDTDSPEETLYHRQVSQGTQVAPKNKPALGARSTDVEVDPETVYGNEEALQQKYSAETKLQTGDEEELVPSYSNKKAGTYGNFSASGGGRDGFAPGFGPKDADREQKRYEKEQIDALKELTKALKEKAKEKERERMEGDPIKGERTVEGDLRAAGTKAVKFIKGFYGIH